MIWQDCQILLETAMCNPYVGDRASLQLTESRVLRGPAFEGERVVSHGYTGAEKSLAANYAPGDVVVFHRAYKCLGVEKGEERRVAAVDHVNRAVVLEGKDGETVPWKPNLVAGRGGAEVYCAEDIALRAGDRIRWTRNDARLGLVNSRTAEVVSVGQDRVAFQLDSISGPAGPGTVCTRSMSSE